MLLYCSTYIAFFHAKLAKYPIAGNEFDVLNAQCHRGAHASNLDL